jgi:UDP-N-acetylglucosamine 2-epimerase (non-hydrolysing)
VAVLINLILGARSNLIKISPIIRAMESRKTKGGALPSRLVHTGQHFGARMSGDFFEQLSIPEPDINLASGLGNSG